MRTLDFLYCRWNDAFSQEVLLTVSLSIWSRRSFIYAPAHHILCTKIILMPAAERLD